MYRPLRGAPACALILVGWMASASPCPAQRIAIGGAESERALRTMGPYVPYDGMSFSQRYHFETGSFIYLGQDPRTLYWSDYFDRLDRACKFGYCPPAEPCFPNGRPAYFPCSRCRWR
jgi:hypothetical protein